MKPALTAAVFLLIAQTAWTNYCSDQLYSNDSLITAYKRVLDQILEKCSGHEKALSILRKMHQEKKAFEFQTDEVALVPSRDALNILHAAIEKRGPALLDRVQEVLEEKAAGKIIVENLVRAEAVKQETSSLGLTVEPQKSAFMYAYAEKYGLFFTSEEGDFRILTKEGRPFKYSPLTGKTILENTKINSMSWSMSPDQTRLVRLVRDSSEKTETISLWSTETGELLSSHVVHMQVGELKTVQLSPDNRFVLAKYSKGTGVVHTDEIWTWDIANFGEPKILKMNGFVIHDVECTPDSKYVLLRGSSGETNGTESRFFNLETGKKERLAREPLLTWFFSPGISAFDKTHSSYYSPDGKFAAYVSTKSNRTVYLTKYSAEERTVVSEILTHENSIASVAFSPDSKKMYVADSDSLRVFDTTSGAEVEGISGLVHKVLRIESDLTGRYMFIAFFEPEKYPSVIYDLREKKVLAEYPYAEQAKFSHKKGEVMLYYHFSNRFKQSVRILDFTLGAEE